MCSDNFCTVFFFKDSNLSWVVYRGSCRRRLRSAVSDPLFFLRMRFIQLLKIRPKNTLSPRERTRRTVSWFSRWENNRSMAWWNTDYKYISKDTHLRWKIKWQLELGRARNYGWYAPLKVFVVCKVGDTRGILSTKYYWRIINVGKHARVTSQAD